jgi:hypothetical protein
MCLLLEKGWKMEDNIFFTVKIKLKRFKKVVKNCPKVVTNCPNVVQKLSKSCPKVVEKFVCSSKRAGRWKKQRQIEKGRRKKGKCKFVVKKCVCFSKRARRWKTNCFKKKEVKIRLKSFLKSSQEVVKNCP